MVVSPVPKRALQVFVEPLLMSHGWTWRTALQGAVEMCVLALKQLQLPWSVELWRLMCRASVAPMVEKSAGTAVREEAKA